MQKVIILPSGHEAQNTQAFEIACHLDIGCPSDCAPA